MKNTIDLKIMFWGFLHPIFESYLNALRSQNPQHIVRYASDFVRSDRSNLTQIWAHKTPKHYLKVYIFAVVLFFSPALLEARSYYLNAEQAEEILAKIPSRPSLGNEEWLKIINGKSRGLAEAGMADQKNNPYTVVTGDNLWNISKKIFANPWYWSKLWQINSQYSNPHRIEAGDLIQIYREEKDSQSIVRIPIVRLTRQPTSDVTTDQYLRSTFKEKFRPKLLLLSENQFLGSIIGGHTPREGFNQFDEFFVQFEEGHKPQLGDIYTIVSVEKRAKMNNASLPDFLVHIVGDIRIIETGDLTRVEITSLNSRLERGDKIVAYRPPTKMESPVTPSENFQTQVLGGELDGRANFANHDLDLFDKGQETGMKLGYVFNALYTSDPVTQKTTTVREGWKADVEVIYVGTSISVGYVLKSRDRIITGETLFTPTPTARYHPPKIQGRKSTVID